VSVGLHVHQSLRESVPGPRKVIAHENPPEHVASLSSRRLEQQAQRTPSSWAATRNLVSQNKSRTGHKQALKPPTPSTELSESSTPTASFKIHPALANLKFTWSRPDLAISVVACFPTCLSSAHGWLDALRPRGIRKTQFDLTTVSVIAFDIVYMHASLCSHYPFDMVPHRKCLSIRFQLTMENNGVSPVALWVC
jgi:hypothetical protein